VFPYTQERIAGELGGLGAGVKGLRDGEGGGALASDLASLVGTLQMGASGWAGPSHWKYKPAKAGTHKCNSPRRPTRDVGWCAHLPPPCTVVVRAKTETGQEHGKEEEEEEEAEEERVSAKKGKKKAAFFIDFSAPPIDTKEAFATTRAATTLSQAVLKKAKEEVRTRTLTTAHARNIPLWRALMIMVRYRTVCCPETSSTTTEPCAPTFSTRLALLALRWSPLVPPHPTPFKPFAHSRGPAPTT